MKQHPISFSNPYLLCICCSSPLGNCGQMRLNIPKIAHKHSCFIKCSTFHLMGQCAPYFLGMYGTHIYLTNNCIWNTSATIIFFTFLKSSFAFFSFSFFLGGEGCLRKKMFPPFFFLTLLWNSLWLISFCGLYHLNQHLHFYLFQIHKGNNILLINLQMF